jgi:hypothetical protein
MLAGPGSLPIVAYTTRKTMGALAVTGALLAGALLAGIGAASPALAQSPSITLLCSAGSNGGTLVNGLCVLPAATAGQT